MQGSGGAVPRLSLALSVLVLVPWLAVQWRGSPLQAATTGRATKVANAALLTFLFSSSTMEVPLRVSWKRVSSNRMAPGRGRGGCKICYLGKEHGTVEHQANCLLGDSMPAAGRPFCHGQNSPEMYSPRPGVVTSSSR